MFVTNEILIGSFYQNASFGHGTDPYFLVARYLQNRLRLTSTPLPCERVALTAILHLGTKGVALQFVKCQAYWTRTLTRSNANSKAPTYQASQVPCGVSCPRFGARANVDWQVRAWVHLYRKLRVRT